MDTAQPLTGQLVRLGMIREADIDLLVRWSEDGRSTRLGDSDPAYPYPEAALRTWWTERLASDATRNFAIRLLDDESTLVGTINLGQVDTANRVAEMGMEIPDPTFWGKGYGTEAVRLLLGFAFDDMNLHRVHLGVFAFNNRAIACYERVGFVREGTHRQYLQRNGRRHDMHLYGILADEWRAAAAAAAT
ncbi:MAG TPA: GNAT family protein [Euzebya sp.]|nr:GNAT family protein [Euzebya sp.]